MGYVRKLFGSGRKLEAVGGAANPVESILESPPASAAYARFRADGEEVTCFIVHEDASHVHRLPRTVRVDVRSALFDRAGAWLIAVMLRVEGNLYETWWNLHNPVLHQSLLDMSRQDKLLVSFYVDSLEPSRTICIQNPLRDGLTHIMAMLEKMPPWDMECFDRAKEQLYSEYPDPEALWNGMAE